MKTIYRNNVIAALRSVVASTFEESLRSAKEQYGDHKDFAKWYEKYKAMEFPVEIYRGLCLDNIHDLDENNLGVHWTDNPEQADCVVIPDGIEDWAVYVLIAQAEQDTVDWEATFKNNLSGFAYEDEITLLPNTPIKVAEIKKVKPNGEWGQVVARSIKGKA